MITVFLCFCSLIFGMFLAGYALKERINDYDKCIFLLRRENQKLYVIISKYEQLIKKKQYTQLMKRKNLNN